MGVNKVIKAVSLLAAMFIASTACAGVIVDIVEQDVTVDLFNPHSYSHDLSEHGFVPGSAQSGSLSIDIYDDADDPWYGVWIFSWQEGEAAVITVEVLDGDTGGVWGGLQGSPAPGWTNILDVDALLALNGDGFLDVTIVGGVDFKVGNSTLTVNTVDAVAAPEPGMLGLLSLGLMGIAGASRRRRKS